MKLTASSGWTAVATDASGSIFFEEQNPVTGTSAVTATGKIGITTGDVLVIAVTLKPASP
jgi:hypothetical protein